MKKKIFKIVLGILCTAVIIWSIAFVTDFVRVSSFKEPIFARAQITADDGGSGIYKGLGYTVEVEKYIDAQYGSVLSSVEMRMFGIVIAAAIS